MLAEALEGTPVVCLLGPRQCGKSTLAQHGNPERGYINEREHIEIVSYRELISRARSRLTWLINELKTTNAS